jgi:ABC-type uncharacterized transport system involved in gliding motility auxiliary subunit
VSEPDVPPGDPGAGPTGEVPPAPEAIPEHDPVAEEIAAAERAEAEEADDGPALGETPRWVPAAVVAGAVLCIEGFIVSRIRTGATEGSPSAVETLAVLSLGLGILGLAGGYVAFLLARVSLARTFEAVVLTVVAGISYYWMASVAVRTLNGDAEAILGVRELELTGKAAALGAIGWIVVCVVAFVLSFRWLTGIVWPHFRSGVALNVLAMVHLVVVLLGVVSFLNKRFVPRASWATLDLTETGRYSLSDKTRSLLGKVEGDLVVTYVDFAAARRSPYPRSDEVRVRDLLLQYASACPRIQYRQVDALRSPDELRKIFLEAGMDAVLEGLTSEEDAVVFGYRPPGEKLVARTRVVPVNADFHDVTALGNQQFRGEAILTTAVNEVVFAQRRILFLEGHGEMPLTGAAGRNLSASTLASALRGDNFVVESRSLARDPRIPADADLVVSVGPRAPFSGAEVESLKEHLRGGGAFLVFLDCPPPDAMTTPTGLEDLFDSWGLWPRMNYVVVSYFAEQTVLRGADVAPITQVLCGPEEFGRHPAMSALRASGFSVVFDTAVPVLHADSVPPGVDLQDLVYAPRLVAESVKPFAMKRVPGQNRLRPPQPGDIVDVRLPLAVSAERATGETEKGGGRVIVVGDTNFVTDLGLDPSVNPTAPAARTFVLNTVSWAVRRDLIAIDPKAIETETVKLRPLDEDLTFWATVVALPVLALGLAVGVWWTRRR